MPTTIDSLQIEIQSSSTNASAGIRDLAKSLGELKRSGTVTTAVKNLNKLSESLRGFADASTATRSLGKLSGALERLQNVGSVSKIGTGLKKIGESLKVVGDINIDDVAPKIERIATAMKPLGEVKAGGINTMVNGLLKLDKVVDGLDDKTIDAFAEKIKKLTTVLEPLSTKMTTIQGGLRGVNSKARSAGSSVKKMGEDVNATALNFATITHAVQTVIQWLDQAIQKFSEFMNQAIEWDGIAARFGRGFGAQAQETYDWIQRLNKEMHINTQVFMQYSSIYATMLTGFGVAMEDATKMALGYTELTYDIWAGYNDVYKTFGEAADAVKSAIAGEVEPIRRAGFTIVESTLEQTAANYGLNISLEKATEAQKSYLRYLTLIDQAHAQSLVGTYAKELNTAEGLMRTFSQQLKSLTQAFGSLFLPILVKIMPYLQAFVDLLTDGVQALAALFGITIQGVDWSGYEDGLGGVTEGADDLAGAVGDATEAIKELKNASVGIDELNVISPPTANSGGSGGSVGDTGFGNLDVESLWDESIFNDINSQVDEIKKKLQDWLPVIATVGTALGGLAVSGLLSGLGKAIAETNTLNKVLGSIAIVTIEAALVFKFADSYLEEGNLLNLLGQAITTATAGYLMFKAWGTGGLIFALGVSIAAQLVAIGLNLADGGVEFSDPQLWIQAAFTAALGGVAGGFLSYKGFTKLSTGQGIMLGLGVGLALTLITITAGEMAANGFSVETFLTGLGAVISGALSAAQGLSYFGVSKGKGLAIGAIATISLIATVDSVSVLSDGESSIGAKIGSALSSAVGMGSTGAMIGSAVAPGAGTVAGFVIGAALSVVISAVSWIIGDDSSGTETDWEKIERENLESAMEDLRDRFGEIKLSVEELEVFVDNIATIPRKITVGGERWNEAIGAMEPYEMTIPVSAAFDFYTTEKDKLVGLESAVERALAELDSNNIKINLGIKVDQATYAKDVESFISNAQSLLDQYYLTTSVAIDILGADAGLSETLSAFYSTNSQRLSELGGQLKQTISDAFVDGEWIPDKLNEAMELQKEIQEILEYVADVEYRAKLKNVELELGGMDITQESFGKAIEMLQETATERLKSLEDIKIENLKVAVIQYDANIESGMSKAAAKKIYDQTVADIEAAYQNGVVEVTYGTIDFGLDTLQDLFKTELSKWDFDFSKELKDAIFQSFGGALVTDNDTYHGLPALIDGLRHQINLGVQAAVDYEDRGAITSMLEQLLPTTQEFEKVAKKAYSMGKSVPENVRNGLNDVAELGALDGDLDAINYMIGMKFSTDPTFLNTLSTVKGAGKSIPKAVAEGFLTNINFAVDESTGLIVGIKDALTGKVYELTPTLKKNLADMGVNVTSGLVSGATTEMKKKEKTWKDWAMWPWNWFKEANEINSPSKLFERGGKHITDGLVKGLEQNSLSKKLSSIWETAKTWWNQKKGSLSTYTPSIGSIKDKVSSAWTTARNWWNKKSGMSTYTPTIGSIKDKLSSAWNTAKKWWNSNVRLSIPSLSFKVTYSNTGLNTVQKAVVKALGMSGWPKLSFAANGGIFDMGSLIWAGERGAEVVANAGGGRTGVMNVQQMQDAVYEGVYAAVLAAMRAGGGNSNAGQAVNVYVDGRQVTAAVEQRQRERGVPLMGSQIYSY